jgi:hypothetical protein
MVDPEEGFLKKIGQAFGKGKADKKRSDQTGADGDSIGIDSR